MEKLKKGFYIPKKKISGGFFAGPRTVKVNKLNISVYNKGRFIGFANFNHKIGFDKTISSELLKNFKKVDEKTFLNFSNK